MSKLESLILQKGLPEVALDRKKQYFNQKVYDFCLTLYIDEDKGSKEQKTFDLSEPIYGVGGVNFGPPTKGMIDEVVKILSKKYSCKVDAHYKIMVISAGTISYELL